MICRIGFHIFGKSDKVKILKGATVCQKCLDELIQKRKGASK